jgi:hypothetical protein
MSDINSVEQEIDVAFDSNALTNVPWTQSAWTLLSAVEDHHFNIAVVHPLPEQEAAIYVDGLVNALTYPLRALHRRAPRMAAMLERRYIEEHYLLAQEWLDAAEDYSHFCSIFPLYRAKEIELTINGDSIKPTNWSKTDLSYEAYDRFVANREPEREHQLDAGPIYSTLRTCIRSSGGKYSIEFTRRLWNALERQFAPAFAARHVLPEDWQFSRFSLSQYRAVFTCLQIAAEAWFVARQIVAPGVRGMAYESAVWTPGREALFKQLSRQTGLTLGTVRDIIRYLTFGEVGVRNPDAAIQPLVDLGNGHYGISPFLITNIDAERNLCVLLNQIPADRTLYSALVDDKEHQIRAETIESLQPLGLHFKYGEVGSTDVDLAIIDHASKVCLCIELKWFIEPAEIREVMMRSEELQKGVAQAKLLNSLFAKRDGRLLALLGIDSDYEFQAMVGSVNFIGRPGIQTPDIPIAKLWHVVSKIKESGSLAMAVRWLKLREYLPVNGRDYAIQEVPIECGRWRSHWYGIAPPNLSVE